MDKSPGWTNGGAQPPQLPDIPGRVISAALIGVLLAVAALTSVYSVQPQEVAVVLRFGAYHDTRGPGLHAKIPLADRVIKVPVQHQLKQEFGFRTLRAGVRTQYAKRAYSEESLMLTGDLNVADVEWVFQYRIQDPRKYLFKVRDPTTTFRDLNEAVMSQIIGDHSVDETLTIGREEIASEAKTRLQELCDLYEIGIKVEQMVLQDVNPPEKVKPSFNEVNQAIQERERLINNAWSEYNKVVPRARGEAEQQIRTAEGYALERVNNAKGEAARFIALYQEYRKAPEVTRRRIYLETVKSVLAGVGEKVVADERMQNLLPLLNLGRGGSGKHVAQTGAGGER